MAETTVHSKEKTGIRELWIYFVLLLFASVAIVAAIHHEPWYDEAQAWLLVRDLPLHDLLFHYLRYEGHPSLWYLILWLPVKAGLPYSLISLISVTLAIAGVWVFLKRSPFPFYIKIIFPFSYFILFQYGVIARNYALLPVLMFVLAATYPERWRHPYRYITVLILLANVSLHGTVIAAGFVALHGIDVFASWKSLSVTERRQQLIVGGVFIATVILLVLQLVSPNDAVVSGGAPDKNPILFLSDGLTGFVFLTILVVGVTLLWLDSKRMLLLLLVPLSGLFILFSNVYKVWHQGIFFLLWMTVLWISFDDSNECCESAAPLRRLYRFGMLLMIVIMLLVQGYWGISAVVHDFHGDYSGTQKLAYYLKHEKLDRKRIFMAGFTTVGVLPYFKTNIFMNFNDGKQPCFWQWSQNNSMIFDILNTDNTDRYMTLITQADPDAVIVDAKFKRNLPLLKRLAQSGEFGPAKVFEGDQFWKNGVFRKEFYVLFQRKTHLGTVSPDSSKSEGGRKSDQ